MLNPISHADTLEKAARYKVEPYVVAADIYGAPPHTGKGGWTWYSGSSAWMYRLGIEAILGITRSGNALQVDPCIPRHWAGFKADYQFGVTHYTIRVENPQHLNRGIQQVVLDEVQLPDGSIPLVDDGQPHKVRVLIGPIPLK